MSAQRARVRAAILACDQEAFERACLAVHNDARAMAYAIQELRHAPPEVQAWWNAPQPEGESMVQAGARHAARMISERLGERLPPV